MSVNPERQQPYQTTSGVGGTGNIEPVRAYIASKKIKFTEIDLEPSRSPVKLEAISAVADDEVPSQSLNTARRLVTRQYLEHFGAKDPETQLLLVSEDEAFSTMYEVDSGYRTKEFLGLMLIDKPDKTVRETCGTMRLLSGKRDELPVEAAQYYTHPEGWDTIDGSKIGEIGRLAFPPFKELGLELNKKDARKIHARILRRLTQRAAIEAESQGIEEIMAITPFTVVRLFEMEGLPPELVEGAELIVNEKNRELYDRFPGYWKDLNPKLYKWKIADILHPPSITLFEHTDISNKGKAV